MGYERGDRYRGRDDDDSRQPRQDYDRSFGRGSYGSAGGQRYGGGDRQDQGRYGYGDDRARGDYGRSGGDRYGGDRSRDYGRQPQGYDYDERGFFDRAGDEVRSWFGDEEAERRRQLDERYEERDHRARQGREAGRSGEGANYGGYDYGASRARGRHDADISYRSWRDRQIEQFDRDYDDYRREHQSKFDSEFHGWRSNRQTQRDSLRRVQEHQEVVGSDGGHVGTVDKVRGDQIILTKQDQDAHGHHHAIPSSWIQSVDEKVTIARTAADAQAHWRDVERNSAFGSDAGRQSGGATGQSAAQTTGSWSTNR